MGRLQRERGATFEREIATLLTARTGVVVKRKLGQARDSGNDLDFPPFVIECKRRRSIAVYEWLEQATAAIGNPGEVPLVVARGDDRAAVAVLYLEDFLTLIERKIHGEEVSVQPSRDGLPARADAG